MGTSPDEGRERKAQLGRGAVVARADPKSPGCDDGRARPCRKALVSSPSSARGPSKTLGFNSEITSASTG